VQLQTSAGTLRIELDDAKAPKSVQLPGLRAQGPLRRHGVPPRHQGLHDPGRRLRARHEAEAHRRADPNEANNGLKNKHYTLAMARTNDPHSATAQFFINTTDNDFLDFRARECAGLGLRGVRPRRRRHRGGGRHRARAHRPQGHARRRAARRRAHQRCHRGELMALAPCPAPRYPGAAGLLRDRRAAGLAAIDFISDLHLSRGTAAHLRGLGRAPAAHAGRRGVHPRRPVRGLGRRRRAHAALRAPLRRGAGRSRERRASPSWRATATSCSAAPCARPAA
jgi:peptidyl-prolyl cis-trans isomerase B (cyclophilin B)